MRLCSSVGPRFNAGMLAAFLLAAAVVSTPVAHAATFVVNTNTWAFDGVCDASDCSLRDAIFEAEAVPGADDIVLQPCETYTLFFVHSTQSGLPEIYSEITIHGNGSTIRRFPSAPEFRLFLVRPGGNLTLDRLTLRWGKVMNGGAGIFNMGTTTVLNSVVENCTIYSDSGAPLSGGGIYNFPGGDLTLERSTVRNNTAPRGAGIYSSGTPSLPSTVTIRNSAIVENQAIDSSVWSVGGGLLITDDTDVSISDTTISSNYALYRGGGLLLYGIPPAYSVSFRNVTITNNEAETNQGGGIDEQTCGITCIDPTDPLVENSIIANNTAAFNPDWVGEYVSGGNNIIGVGSGSFPTTTGDQTVTTLADVGPLVPLGQAGGQHHRLLFGNTGIDAGNSGLCAAEDQIDLARLGADCEIGAVEFRDCVAAPADLDAWWSFDEVLGGGSEDSAGTVANDGSYSGIPVPGTGMVEGALCFKGASEAVVAADDDELDFFGDCGGTTDDLTIDVWVKTAAHGLQPIVDKRESAAGFLRGYHMYILDGRLGFQLATGSGSSTCGVGGSACDDYLSPVPTPGDVDLRDDRWHFVAVSVDRCGAGLGRMYIDGDLVQTFTPRVGEIANAADLRIGERYPVPSAATFKGCLDELEIFDRALTEPELDAIHDAGWAGKCKGPCDSTNYPTCGGLCPDGDRCVPNDATEHCECVTDPIPCNESDPVCNGECPMADQQCVTDAVGDCRCEPIPPCSETDAPECGGFCPSDGEVCHSANGQSCLCVTPQSIPCGDSDAPECLGACVGGMNATCRYIAGEDTCRCESEVLECADATPPLCKGACDLGKTCKPGPSPTDPCECKFCLVAKPSGWTTVSWPSKKEMWWTELECAATYNVYESTVAQLVDVNRDGLADDYGSCLQAGLEIEHVEETFTPQPGILRHYLVTGVNPVGEGDMGYASNARERRNLNPCP